MGSKALLFSLGLLCLSLGCAGTETDDWQDSEARSDSFDTSDWTAIQARCQPPSDDEENLYTNDYRWGYTLEELDERYQQLYQSPKRLFDRARYDPDKNQFELPYVESWGGSVVLSERLISNVRIHIEKALERKYVQAIIFPDMGHSHFFVPQEHWDAVYAGGPVSEISHRTTELFEDPELRVLYHTAEQLQMLDEERNLLPDPDLQWRHYTRNIVGDNRGAGVLDILRDPTSLANTARDMEGHHYIGAGFSVSANKNGCFPFVHEGETFFFDLSLSDAPLDPSVPVDDGGF